MRTTIRIDSHLLAHVKMLAAQSGRTMNSIIEDAIRSMIVRTSQVSERGPRVRLTTVGGHALLPGIDLDDSAGLLDEMERSD